MDSLNKHAFNFISEDRNMWHNTGLSSSINWGTQLLTTEADIVTAHGNIYLMFFVSESSMLPFSKQLPFFISSWVDSIQRWALRESAK
jgi:hypothetical protein